MDVSGSDDQGCDPIQELVHKDLEEEGFELVDLQFKRAKGHYLLRIFMDHENGVNIEDCERVSQRISESLDKADLIPGPYLLEVSSPGLDRPLKREKDFKRFQGQWIKLTFGEPLQGFQSMEGKILSVEGQVLSVEDRQRETYRIPISHIQKARLIVDF